MGNIDLYEEAVEFFENEDIDINENEEGCNEKKPDYLKKANNWSNLTIEEQNKYIELAKSGDKEAISFILQGISSFVYKKATYYAYQNHLDVMDLYQEGMVGVMYAIQKFDLSKNVKFLSFATYYIKLEIFKFLYNKANIIRVPANLIEKYFRIKRNLYCNHNISERDYLLQQENISEFDYFKIWSIRNIKSLDSSYNYDGHNSFEKEEYTLLDTVTSSYESDFSSREIMKDRKLLINELLDSLSEKARIVIMMRFGIGYDKEYTLDEIGKTMGLTKERIRQIEAKALRQFRSILYRKHIFDINDY